MSKPPPRSAVVAASVQDFDFNVKVSSFKTVRSLDAIDQPLNVLLEQIRGGEYAGLVSIAREIYQREGKSAPYATAKKKLPAFTMSGTCDRGQKTLRGHSGVVQLDLDELGERLAEVRGKLTGNRHVLFGFLSPSGDGLKIGLRIDGARHAESWQSAAVYFRDTFGIEIDAMPKSERSLCFLSHDPDLWTNKAAVPLPVKKSRNEQKPNVCSMSPFPMSPVSMSPPTMSPRHITVWGCGASVGGVALSADSIALFKEQIERAISAALPTETGRNNQAAFQACLNLLAIRGEKDFSQMPGIQKRLFADSWHTRLCEVKMTTTGKPKSHYLLDIMTAMNKAVKTSANPIPQAWALTQSEPLPPEAEFFNDAQGADAQLVKFVSLCFQLHRLANGGQWFISTKKAAELIFGDKDKFHQVSDWFKLLVTYGILELVTP
jgi:hypothetical protein